MSSYHYSLAGIFLAAGMAAAAADEPALQTGNMAAVSVTTLGGHNFRNFVLEESVLSNNSTIRGRAYVDDVLGITCEWLEKGRSAADGEGRFHIVDRKPEVVGCVASDKLPSGWENGDRFFSDIPEMVYQDKSRFGIIHELIEAQGVDEVVLVKREWNIAAQEVCLQTMEVPVDHEGEYGQPFNHTWGCFAVRDKAYFNKVMDAAGLRPA